MNNLTTNTNQQDDIADIMNGYVDLAIAMQQEADHDRAQLEQILKDTNNGDSNVQPDSNQDLKQFAAQATADQTT